MKHGLSESEAIAYSQLNSDFDVHALSKAQKQWLDNDFHAQVYAFRKLRDKMISDEMGLQHLYKPVAHREASQKRPDPQQLRQQVERQEHQYREIKENPGLL